MGIPRNDSPTTERLDSSMIELLAWFLAPPDFTAQVAVHAAYVIHTRAEVPAPKCCGTCKGGWITHGDGHKTPCPCPAECECKQ